MEVRDQSLNLSDFSQEEKDQHSMIVAIEVGRYQTLDHHTSIAPSEVATRDRSQASFASS